MPRTYTQVKDDREETERKLASLKTEEEQSRRATIRSMTVGEVENLGDAGVFSKDDVARLFGIGDEGATEASAEAKPESKHRSVRIAKKGGSSIKRTLQALW